MNDVLTSLRLCFSPSCSESAGATVERPRKLKETRTALFHPFNLLHTESVTRGVPEQELCDSAPIALFWDTKFS